MPLFPVPVPGVSPLPLPGRRPPDRRALRLGALVGLPVLVVALLIGQLLVPQILFLVPGLEAQALVSSGASGGGAAAAFQGFAYDWSARDQGSGYSGPASLTNLQSEASVFHMNSVIIPVIGDVPERSGSTIYWHAGQHGDLDTLPDSEYVAAIANARKAGLVPILELELKQQDFTLNPGIESPFLIGNAWWDSTEQISLENGSTASVVTLERDFFDNYTQFAVHYAQLAQQYHLPYFVIGADLVNTTYDSPNTTRKADPGAIYDEPGTSYAGTCSGRRDCEWRHVIHAVRAAAYLTLGGNHSTQTGAGYAGKLIYAASWTGVPDKAAGPEYSHISWWDAVDYIGVNAYFPITQNEADASVTTLSSAWHGKGQDLGGQGDIYAALEKVSDSFHKPVLFTAAGYESESGSNQAPGNTTKNGQDDQEQLNDVQALLQTFTGTPWWAGAFWSADEPVAPRTSQPNWQTSTAWAGTTLADSKPAGQFLAQFYKNNPISCHC